ncbi:MAG: hypothetical protein GEU80_13620 [Dehalococcoidia bacterium]|nr:hypothetical protein [Dehalococcoidia bacterium]
MRPRRRVPRAARGRRPRPCSCRSYRRSRRGRCCRCCAAWPAPAAPRSGSWPSNARRSAARENPKRAGQRPSPRS